MPITYTDGSYLTEKGNNLIAKLLASRGELLFTKVTVGSGTVPEGKTPESMTDLAEYRMNGMIAAISNPLGGEATVTVQALSDGLEEGFPATELALWAEDPDEGEILYTYLSIAQHPEWMRPDSDPVKKLANFTIITIVSGVPLVSATIHPDAFARASDLKDHIEDPEAHREAFERFNAAWTDAFIVTIPIATSEVMAAWDLYENIGGIKAPLEVWGFTNSTMKKVDSRVDIDINKQTLSVFSIPTFADMTWEAEPYEDNAYILTAPTKSLILIRR